jgi:hypothetical protein
MAIGLLVPVPKKNTSKKEKFFNLVNNAKFHTKANSEMNMT